MKQVFIRILLLMLLVLSIGKVQGQNGWSWVQGVDGTGDEQSHGMTVDTANGWVYFVGEWLSGSGLSGRWGNDFLTNAGGRDIFVAKYDTNSNFIWAFSVGSAGDDVAYDVDVDGAGNIYVTGSYTDTTDFNGIGGGVASLPGGTIPKFFLAKYNSTGTLQWVTRSSTGFEHSGMAVEADASGIYVTGSYRGVSVFQSAPPSLVTGNGQFNLITEQIFLVAYNSSGVLQWLVDAGGSGNDGGKDLSLDNNYVYLIGDYESNSLGIYDGLRPGTPNALIANGGNKDIIIASFFKLNGQLNRSHRIYSANDDFGTGIKIDGSLFVTGSVGSHTAIFPGTFSATNSNPPAIQQEFFIASIDQSTGLSNWARIENGIGNNSGSGIDTDFRGKLYVSGHYSNTLNMSGNLLVSNSGSRDIFVAQYNPLSGQFIRNHSSGDANAEEISEIECGRESLYAAGYYNNDLNFSPLTTRNDHPSDNVFVGKMDVSVICDPSFSYASASYCLSGSNPTANITGNTGGTFSSSPAGLIFADPATGEIDLSLSSAGPYTLTYTAPGGCTATQSISLVAPAPANAGPDQTGATNCGTNFTTLQGSDPGAGSGAWGFVPGSAVGGTISNPGNRNSGLSGTPDSTYILQWLVVNAPCPVTYDTVVISFPREPTLANAGPDQTGSALCGLPSALLAANSPSVGTPQWSIISGPPGTFGNLADPNTTFLGTPGGNYQLEWTISYPPCPASSDTVAINFPIPPTPANAGGDQLGNTNCGLDSTLIRGNTPTNGTGLWTFATGSGSGGTIVNPSAAITHLVGTAGETYFLVWTISNSPCDPSRDTITVEFPVSPVASNAGPDQTGAAMCGQTQATLNANSALPGTGTWTAIPNTGSFSNANSPSSTFTGVPGQSYILNWSIMDGVCPPSVDIVIVDFPEPPSPANAGPDSMGPGQCGATSLNLQANSPSVGLGTWSIVSVTGSSFIANPGDPNSALSGTPGSEVTLQWTISNPPCGSDSDQVTIAFPALPTPADAGPDQAGPEMCGSTFTLLEGNDPNFGSGTWSILSGAGGAFTDPTQPRTGFAGTSGTTYNLLWIISNPPCEADTDTVSITFQLPPNPPDAGANVSVCGNEVQLTGSSPGGGSGSWTLLSGGGTFNAPNLAQTTVTGLITGLNVFQWRVTQGICADSAEVAVTSFPPVTVPSLPDTTTCEPIFQLYAQAPDSGFGFWRPISPGLQVQNPLQPGALVSGMTAGPNQLEWVVVNGPCRDSTTLLMEFLELSPDAGPDQVICIGDTVSLSAGNPMGYWTIDLGSGSLTNDSLPQTTVLGISDTLNRFLWYQIDQGCTLADTLFVRGSLPATVVNAGPDQTLQGNTATQLSALPPDHGTGTWSLNPPSQPVTIVTPSSGTSRVENLQPGPNTFLWTVSNPPCPDISDEVVIVLESLMIPDAFSPNGDNVNDQFVIEGIHDISGTELNVFNRWGNEVYANGNYRNDWNGDNLKGNPLSDDTYYYVLQIPDRGTFKGFVVIRRKQ